MVKFVAISLFCIFLCGCSPEEYVNASKKKPYIYHLGKELTLLKTIKAQGTSFTDNKKVDYVILSKPPGSSGNHIQFKYDVDKNLTFKIVGAVHSGYIESLERYFVVVFDNGLFSEYVVLLPITEDLNQTNLGLNSDLVKIKDK